MAYLGNSNLVQNFTPAVDYFNGNGSTTSFTLSRTVGSAFDIQAFIENVPQNPSSAFTVAGNVITFTSAPPSGTNNIYVRYTSPVVQLVKPAPGTVGATELAGGPVVVSDQLNTSTGYFDLPAGTTAQRPASPVVGMTRYNTTLNQFEVYQNGSWTQYVTSYSVDYLIVAGGGGGGGGFVGGGGGAGGAIYSTFTTSSATAYPVTVGAGGAGGANYNLGVNGSNSSVFSLTSLGGGGGGSAGVAGTGGNAIGPGQAGGSGGGGPSKVGNAGGRTGTGVPNYGLGTAGQGNNGGTGVDGWSVCTNGAGGGGAGAVGADANACGTSPSAGAGGAGVNWQSLGTFYAGGGGGGTDNGTSVIRASGGSGGGGAGGIPTAVAGIAGTANTGGGGGGAGDNSTGGTGGSGIVIVRYSGSQRGTGGTITSAGGYTYHTFTSSGTFTA